MEVGLDAGVEMVYLVKLIEYNGKNTAKRRWNNNTAAGLNYGDGKK